MKLHLLSKQQNLKIMALPSLCLGLAGAAPLVRMTRNSILEIIFAQGAIFLISSMSFLSLTKETAIESIQFSTHIFIISLSDSVRIGRSIRSSDQIRNRLDAP